MVGDGLNDAAALALAHVSISPGTAVDATQAAADMVLQGEALMPIVDAIDVARQTRRRVLENFAFAAGLQCHCRAAGGLRSGHAADRGAGHGLFLADRHAQCAAHPRGAESAEGA